MAKVKAVIGRGRVVKMISPKPIRYSGTIRGNVKISSPNIYDEPMSEPKDENSKAFDERYKKESSVHLEEIEFILSNIIERSDFRIERDNSSFYLRREDTKGYIYYRIGKGQINIECNDYQSQKVDSFYISDSTLYEKWHSKLEDKYFEQFNASTKNTLSMICNLTNLSRKTKITKFLKEEKKKGA